MKLVFATNNQHKLDEVRKVVTGDFEIVSLSEIDCHDDIPETADTLEGNALQKLAISKNISVMIALQMIQDWKSKH